jgi:hypothetical protein
MAKTATYSLIASNTLGSANSTITFSSIPATFTDLVLVCNLFSSGTTYSNIRFNGDTGTNYSLTDFYGDGGGGITSSRQSNVSQGGSGPTMGSGNVLIYNILDYSNSNTYKNMLGRNSNPSNGVFSSVSMWRSTAAINSITLFTGVDNWSVGSTFKLYGIKAGNA